MEIEQRKIIEYMLSSLATELILRRILEKLKDQISEKKKMIKNSKIEI